MPIDLNEYLLLTLFNILMSLVLAVAAVAGMFYALRLRDRFAGIDWPTLRTKITSTPQGAAIWAAAWVIALGLILAAAIR